MIRYTGGIQRGVLRTLGLLAVLGMLLTTASFAQGALSFQTGVTVDVSATATINLVFAPAGGTGLVNTIQAEMDISPTAQFVSIAYPASGQQSGGSALGGNTVPPRAGGTKLTLTAPPGVDYSAGTIAVITVRGVSSGAAGLTLRNINASDDLATTVTVTASSGSLTVNSVTPSGTTPTWNTAATLTAGTQNTAYNTVLSASGSPTPTYAITSGAAPAGVTLSTAGVLSGTPTASGDFTFTVRATNTIGTADRTFTLHIAPVTPTGTAPTFTTAAGPLAAGQVSVAYTGGPIAASGTATIAFTVTAGSLPPGVTLSTAGALSGTPTTQGTFTFTVTANNGVNPNATRQFSITIAAAPVALTARITATGGDPGAIILDGTASTGSPTAYSWTLVSGPAGAAPLFGNPTDFSGRGSFFLPSNTAPKTTFLARAAGQYTFQLSISKTGSSTSATASATIQDKQPKAIALPGDIITRRNITRTFVLDGRQSVDPNRADVSLAYSWSLQNLGNASLSSANTALTTLTIPADVTSSIAGSVVLTVTAADNQQATNSFRVLAAIALPPQANAGFSRTIITTGASIQVQLYGRDSATRGTGAPTYAWSQIFGSSVSFAPSAAATDPVVTLPSATGGALYGFRLTVTQGGLSDTDDVSIRVVRIQATGSAPLARFTITRTDGVAVNTALPSAAGPIVADITATATSVPIIHLDASTSTGANAYTWSLLKDSGVTSGAPTAGATLSAFTGAQVDLLASGTGTYNVVLTVADTTSGRTAFRRGIITVRSSTTPLKIDSTATTVAGVTVTPATQTLPAVTSATTVTLTAAASGGTAPIAYSWIQLTEARARAILALRLGSDQAAAQYPDLLRGGTTPQLADFQSTLSGASVTFTLLPAGGAAGDPAVGGTYVFLLTARDMDGVSVSKIVNVPIAAGGQAPVLPQISSFTAVETDDGLTLSASGAQLINSSNVLQVDVSGFLDRASGKTLGQLLAAAGSKAFVRWTFLNGTIDLTDACTAANSANSAKLTAQLSSTQAGSSPSFRLGVSYDNGAAQGSAIVDSGFTATQPASGTTVGTSDSGGLCAMRRDAQQSAGLLLDLLVLLLPIGLIASRRQSLCRQELMK